jgi:hypothetical protein
VRNWHWPEDNTKRCIIIYGMILCSELNRHRIGFNGTFCDFSKEISIFIKEGLPCLSERLSHGRFSTTELFRQLLAGYDSINNIQAIRRTII